MTNSVETPGEFANPSNPSSPASSLFSELTAYTSIWWLEQFNRKIDHLAECLNLSHPSGPSGVIRLEMLIDNLRGKAEEIEKRERTLAAAEVRTEELKVQLSSEIEMYRKANKGEKLDLPKSSSSFDGSIKLKFSFD